MSDGFEFTYAACAGLNLLIPGNTIGDGDYDSLSNLHEFQAEQTPAIPTAMPTPCPTGGRSYIPPAD